VRKQVLAQLLAGAALADFFALVFVVLLTKVGVMLAILITGALFVVLAVAWACVQKSVDGHWFWCQPKEALVELTVPLVDAAKGVDALVVVATRSLWGNAERLREVARRKR
jgi:hypothetical protein